VKVVSFHPTLKHACLVLLTPNTSSPYSLEESDVITKYKRRPRVVSDLSCFTTCLRKHTVFHLHIYDSVQDFVAFKLMAHRVPTRLQEHLFSCGSALLV